MKQVRKNGAGIHISAGLSGYIAELGAAFLCGDLGVANDPRADHAAYLAQWLEILREDDRAIFKAARLAEAAADYLLGREGP